MATKTTVDDPVESVYGILHLGRPTDELVTVLRGDPDTG